MARRAVPRASPSRIRRHNAGTKASEEVPNGPGLTISLQDARRLILLKQRVSGGPRRTGNRDGILSVIRDLCYVQWDPVTVVAPSHLLSFWARLEGFRPDDLERLLWEEKSVIEYWTPIASLVLSEDYPIYASMMRRYPDSLTRSWGRQRDAAKRFLKSHAALRREIVRDLREGPRALGELKGHDPRQRAGDDWNPASDVAEMLLHLTMAGEVMVVGHRGAQNLWGLSETFLPRGLDRRPLSELEFEREAAQRAIRALGVATLREIVLYFPRGRYQHLPSILDDLEADGRIRRVAIEGAEDRGARYLHTDDLGALDSLDGRDWENPTSLLPPFDTLLTNTDRMVRLFGFRYIREQFLPRAKRQYGTYVLPIVRGDRIVGRIDPKLDRANDRLVVLAVHAEPAYGNSTEVARDVRDSIRRLAELVGVHAVSYAGKVPSAWQGALH